MVGVPDEKWGEAVKAVVQLKPNQTVNEEDIMALCKADWVAPRRPRALNSGRNCRAVQWASCSRRTSGQGIGPTVALGLSSIQFDIFG